MQQSRKSLYEYTKKIRDLINNPRKRHGLLKNRALWNQLCSCLDVIEDSDLAIDVYLTKKLVRKDGTKYLAVYGLLQALFLQQDAITYLCESLGIPFKIENYPRLKEIRDIRNDSIGHPTKRGGDRGRKKKDQPISYHFISRPTLSLKGFQLISYYSNGKRKFRDVSIPDLISDQKQYVSEILLSVVGRLEQEEKAHKDRFRMEKLASIFLTSSPGYAFEKLYKVLLTGEIHHPIYGELNLQQIKKMLDTFKEGLARRGIELETYDSIKFMYEELEYPLNELEKFFQNAKEGKTLNINEETAYIFVFFVEKQIDELKEIAEEIDKDYSN
jgi:hypothetical protein